MNSTDDNFRDPLSQVYGYRNLTVQLDGTAEDEIRLAHAESIASLFHSHLTGIYTRLLPDVAFYPSPAGGSARIDLEKQAREESAIARRQLIERFGRIGGASHLRAIEAMSSDLHRLVATQARLADLFVTSCPSGAHGDHASSIIDTALFQGGRGVYLAPQGVRPREAIRTIAIGWIDTREAARAVTEAMPLLRLAASAHLICVAGSGDVAVRQSALSDVAAHLERHGVSVNAHVIAADSGVAATAILDEAHRVSADLIVTGAFGHSRLHEWILGGATRDLLAKSDVPLLMAH
jgi:nucleotide-binding universal stress UspA family protein